MQEAEKAKEKTNGYHLSKRGESDIILAVYTFDDIERLMNMNEEWEPPQTKPYVPNVYKFSYSRVLKFYQYLFFLLYSCHHVRFCKGNYESAHLAYR